MLLPGHATIHPLHSLCITLRAHRVCIMHSCYYSYSQSIRQCIKDAECIDEPCAFSACCAGDACFCLGKRHMHEHACSAEQRHMQRLLLFLHSACWQSHGLHCAGSCSHVGGSALQQSNAHAWASLPAKQLHLPSFWYNSCHIPHHVGSSCYTSSAWNALVSCTAVLCSRCCLYNAS